MAAKRIRIHDLAKELGMTNAEILDLCGVLGVAAKGPSSSIAEAYADMVSRRAKRDGLTRDTQPTDTDAVHGKPQHTTRSRPRPKVKKTAPFPPNVMDAAPGSRPATAENHESNESEVLAPSANKVSPGKRVLIRRPPAPSTTGGAQRSKEEELRQLISGGESKTLEFKQTARINLFTGERDSKIEFAVLKTIAGFLNTNGGHLLVGVADDGSVSGIEVDLRTLGKKQDLDGFELWLTDLLVSNIGTIEATKVTIDFVAIDGRTVCSVKVAPGDKPSFVRTKATEFYARVGNSTRQLDTEETMSYVNHHWPR